MKHNLKTFPKTLKSVDDTLGNEVSKHTAEVLASHCVQCKKVLQIWAENQQATKELDDWKEGFEKELRNFKIIDWLDKNHIDEKWATCGADLIGTLAKFILKEILGEA